MRQILQLPTLNSRLSTILLAAALLGTTLGRAQELQPITLPQPRMEGGKPLMETLKARQSLREFSPEKLPLQVLSDLLWAGFGVNRPTNDHRTAPSAMNSQEIDIYVATGEGVYRYEAKANRLQPVLTGDFRAKTGGQDFVKDAPVALLFVADFARLEKAKPEEKDFYSAIDTGFISQNIYLYCASEGLATVVRALDGRKLHDTFKLKPQQKIVIAQSVGYPRQQPAKAGGAQ